MEEVKKNTLTSLDKLNSNLSKEYETRFQTINDIFKNNFEEIEKYVKEINSNESLNSSIKEIKEFLNEEISQKIIKEEIDPDLIIKRIEKESEIEINNNNNDTDISSVLVSNNNNNNSIKLNEIEKKKFLQFMNKSNSLNKLQDDANKILKFHKIEEFIDEFNYEKFEKKLDENINNMEKAFDEILEKMEGNINLKKENFVILQPNVLMKFKEDPKDFISKMEICQTSHSSNSIDSTFCTFKTFTGDVYVCWGTPNKSLDIFDLKKKELLKSVLNAHTSTIFSCRHYQDLNNKNDLLVTSSLDQTVKVWSVKENFANILHIKNAASVNYIYSVSILCEKFEKKNYVISACSQEQMKIWDFNGQLLKSIGSGTQSTYFVDVVYHNKQEKYFIINANSDDVKSYHFKSGLLYHSYKSTPSTWHMSAILNQLPDINQLIESDGLGNISIWNFDNANLLKKIKYSTSNLNLRGICLWNDRFLFTAASNNNIILVDLEKEVFVKEFKSHSKTACSVQKIYDEKYGECLISHSLDGKLILWGRK
jgi:WD40 repeat protein